MTERGRRVVIVATAAGATQLGVSLASKPDSKRFYGLTAGVAATWLAAGATAGPIERGWERAPDGSLRRPLLRPIALGVGAFALFYLIALVARRIPVLRTAISGVLVHAHHGTTPWVLATTLANGVGEEVFFRGAVYSTLTDGPAVGSTAVYALVTGVTGNPALVLASIVMGALFGWQRRCTGGIQASVLTHVTWSTLMFFLLPPLFRRDSGASAG